MADDYQGPRAHDAPSQPAQPSRKGFAGFLRRHVDVEMWKAGWWMLTLVIGTIVVLFIVSTIMVSKYPAPPAP